MPNQVNIADADTLVAELVASKEREAATREILEIVSRSRDNEEPVLNAILESASKLCKSPIARLHLLDDGGKHHSLAAHWGEDMRSLKIGEKWPMNENHLIPSTIRESRTIHLHDLKATDLYQAGEPLYRRLVDEEGLRTRLTVPLLHGDRSLGCIALSRRQVMPFRDEEIELVETFAAQAVIAIENVRQLRALEERSGALDRSNQELEIRLERETATREVLQAISQGRDHDTHVFKVILENAARLCDAPNAYLHLCNEDRTHLEVAAYAGTRDGFLDYLADHPLPLDASLSQSAQSVLDKTVLQIEDLAADGELYRMGQPHRIRAVDIEGMRTLLTVPLISGDQAIGIFSLYRREVRNFDARQIELVQTFAAQAVIAIENERHFKEQKARLEREAATREILEVISQSRADEGPVFDAILSNAQRLCGAPFGVLTMMTDDGAHLEIMTEGAEPFDPFRPGWRWPMDSQLLVVRSVREKAVLQLDDVAQDQLYTQGDPGRVTVVNAGMRSALTVPLVSGGRGVGSLALFRREVRPFTPDEIALVQTFAEQAVIAIENVRQFKLVEARTEEIQAINASLETRVKEQVGEIERMGRLKRFLPSAVADTVVSSGSEAVLKSHRALLGVLFCDIRGFTAFCETAEPEETIDVLQTYHEEMGKLIDAHEAGVDHRMGDGIMVLFNDPLPCDDPAGDAVRLAVAMRTRMAELCKQWKRLGHRLGFGVGVSLGYATVGMVGYEGRYDYTASGTSINLAARLCDRAKDGEILLSLRAHTAVEDDFKTTSDGEVSLKGIREPVEVFKLMDAENGSSQE